MELNLQDSKAGLTLQECSELCILFMMTDFLDAAPEFYYERRRSLMIKATDDQKRKAFVDAYGLSGEKLSEGICRCLREPKGEEGLEGYMLGRAYRFEKMKKVNLYFKVFPDENNPEYYETCGAYEFKRYFSIETENS